MSDLVGNQNVGFLMTWLIWYRPFVLTQSVQLGAMKDSEITAITELQIRHVTFVF